MPVYAENGVRHIWLLNPMDKTLDVFARTSDGGGDATPPYLLNAFAGNDKVRAEPFREIEIDLGEFWLE